MKIGEMLANVIKELSAQPEHPDSYGYQTLEATVDPAVKDIIVFLLHFAKNRMGRPYNEIETGIQSDPFTYRIKGAEDKIQLQFGEHFFRHGGNLKTFFKNLCPKLDYVIQEITTGWVLNNQGYQNPNFFGTYYAFLLNAIARQLDFNKTSQVLSFSTWLPVSGWVVANEVYLYGNQLTCDKFLKALSSELFLNPDYFVEQKAKPSVPSNLSFLQEMSLNNMRIANIKASGNVQVTMTDQESSIRYTT